MLRKGMIWMPMDKKDQLAELISNAETSFYNGQLQEAFSLSLSAIKLDENCNISKLPAELQSCQGIKRKCCQKLQISSWERHSANLYGAAD